MKYLLVFIFIITVSLNAKADIWLQDNQGNWKRYDDGCPCANTFVTSSGTVTNIGDSCCTCC